MNKKFKENIDIRITAAQIGISEINWDSVNNDVSREEVVEFMKIHKYDVVPIKDQNGEYKSFWTTKKMENSITLRKHP